MHSILIARQPIFDPHLETIGYELRYGRPAARAEPATAQEAQRFLDVVLDLGLDTLVGTRLAIVALPPAILTTVLPDLAPMLPLDRLVLSVTPQQLRDAEIGEALRRSVTLGCRILLNLSADDAVTASLLADVDVVRLSLRHPHPGGEQRGPLERWLALRLAECASWRPRGLRVLVADVRDYQEFARARALGADLFQGDFLFRPLHLRARRQPVSQAALLLLARLNHPSLDFEEVEHLLAQDVQLTYRLLKLVNAVWFARRTRVESLRQALLVLGLRNVTAWVTISVLAGVERKPVELVRAALVRARMCELVAGALGMAPRETAFLTGLLSVIDAALDIPLPEALAALPVTDEVADALLSSRGALGTVLAAVRSYEFGDWSALQPLPLPIAPELLTEAFIEALAFAAEALAALELTP
ncbi:MAG: HDOD domain-containing protein [Thermomicrobium sp.]|nr:HDOD domain-containing protein [Thermomicrobium sp.]MDW7982673.1 HDOD domain-containing protein [Thermomicrobium sp.]